MLEDALIALGTRVPIVQTFIDEFGVEGAPLRLVLHHYGMAQIDQPPVSGILEAAIKATLETHGRSMTLDRLILLCSKRPEVRKLGDHLDWPTALEQFSVTDFVVSL